eukprot:COSAG06_NODE_26738_length_608_cov_0.948919_2_plen_117_part_00
MDPVLHLCIAAKKWTRLGAQTLAMIDLIIDLIIDLNESSLDLESSVVAVRCFAVPLVALLRRATSRGGRSLRQDLVHNHLRRHHLALVPLGFEHFRVQTEDHERRVCGHGSLCGEL